MPVFREGRFKGIRKDDGQQNASAGQGPPAWHRFSYCVWSKCALFYSNVDTQNLHDERTCGQNIRSAAKVPKDSLQRMCAVKFLAEARRELRIEAWLLRCVSQEYSRQAGSLRQVFFSSAAHEVLKGRKKSSRAALKPSRRQCSILLFFFIFW